MTSSWFSIRIRLVVGWWSFWFKVITAVISLFTSRCAHNYNHSWYMSNMMIYLYVWSSSQRRNCYISSHHYRRWYIKSLQHRLLVYFSFNMSFYRHGQQCIQLRPNRFVKMYQRHYVNLSFFSVWPGKGKLFRCPHKQVPNERLYQYILCNALVINTQQTQHTSK